MRILNTRLCITAYCITTLSLVSYGVFVKGFSSWLFVMVVFLDIMHYAYQKGVSQ